MIFRLGSSKFQTNQILKDSILLIKNETMRNYLIILILLFANLSSSQAQNSNPDKPNVLFIMVDDLRNNLGAYGDEQAITPNIDALAKRGVTFRNHQVQYAVCGPSRAVITTRLLTNSQRRHFLKYSGKARTYSGITAAY